MSGRGFRGPDAELFNRQARIEWVATLKYLSVDIISGGRARLRRLTI